MLISVVNKNLTTLLKCFIMLLYFIGLLDKIMKELKIGVIISK